MVSYYWRRGFSRMASRGHSPPPPTSTHPGSFPETAQLGEADRAHVPLRSEGGGEGLGAQMSARGLGTPGAGSEGERAAGSWFPRSPRAPHSMSLQVSTQFCQHWGAVLAPARPARDSGSSGERAGKCEERTVGERYRGPCASRLQSAASRSPCGQGPHSRPDAALSPPVPHRARCTRSRDATRSSIPGTRNSSLKKTILTFQF